MRQGVGLYNMPSLSKMPPEVRIIYLNFNKGQKKETKKDRLPEVL
jgi:hypothetical protein